MIVRIARQEAIDKYLNFPLRQWNSKEEEYDYLFPTVFASYVLTLQSKSYRGHIKLLGTELTMLIKSFGYDKLIFIGDIDIPWLKREHDFKPAKEALQYLVDNKIGKRFNGALQVDTSQLPTFIIHLAWLVRTNAVLPYVHFVNPNQNLIGTVCQYGNLHFWTVDEKTDEIFKTKIIETKFEFMTDQTCYDKFSKTGAIKGRQLTL